MFGFKKIISISVQESLFWSITLSDYDFKIVYKRRFINSKYIWFGTVTHKQWHKYRRFFVFLQLKWVQVMLHMKVRRTKFWFLDFTRTGFYKSNSSQLISSSLMWNQLSWRCRRIEPAKRWEKHIFLTNDDWIARNKPVLKTAAKAFHCW